MPRKLRDEQTNQFFNLVYFFPAGQRFQIAPGVKIFRGETVAISGDQSFVETVLVTHGSLICGYIYRRVTKTMGSR